VCVLAFWSGHRNSGEVVPHVGRFEEEGNLWMTCAASSGVVDQWRFGGT
jgi:hypothetical protein